ncbi:alpha/beta-hydrolase [Glonium stellatum]|uniref:Alpha/beta-hydrolase n=1 Tax=Glonium stellatum TaxID=574774 RepID=A0A8E2F591_9PEZI|nr:alpha/beta-hydrolase [Glonium stellatum]
MSPAIITDSDPTLPYTALNSDGIQTILLVHGAFSSAQEWDVVVSQIPQKYHILLPDLPSHGRGSSIGPFNVELAARLLANIITAHAHGGKAHIVGLSLGAHVVAHLASNYPDLVDTVFASGFKILKPSFITPMLPSLFYSMQHATNMLPRSLIRMAMDGADITTTQNGVISIALCREIINIFTTAHAQEPIAARTLVVAATKSGLVPSNDSVEDAKVFTSIARKGNELSKGVQHKGMRHPWNRQSPELFAEAIICWIEQRTLPNGFQDI